MGCDSPSDDGLDDHGSPSLRRSFMSVANDAGEGTGLRPTPAEEPRPTRRAVGGGRISRTASSFGRVVERRCGTQPSRRVDDDVAAERSAGGRVNCAERGRGHATSSPKANGLGRQSSAPIERPSIRSVTTAAVSMRIRTASPARLHTSSPHAGSPWSTTITSYTSHRRGRGRSHRRGRCRPPCLRSAACGDRVGQHLVLHDQNSHRPSSRHACRFGVNSGVTRR